MTVVAKHVRPLAKKALALGKIRPADPVEVLYLERLNLAFLVVSKNACSSVKESFVSTVLGHVDLPFEKIHNYLHQNQVLLENKGLFLHRFYSRQALNGFLENKNLLIIQRPIVSRLQSAYADYITGKNRMIFPVFPRYSLERCKQPGWDFERFAKVIAGIGDYLSDRHYRSQSFLWDAIPTSCSVIKVDIKELRTQFSEHLLLKELAEPRKRNQTDSVPKQVVLATTSQMLRHRYAIDIRTGVTFE